MTVQQILFDFANSEPKKPVGRATLYLYLRKFKIKPTSRAVHPVQYPADTPRTIRIKIGLLNPRDARNGGIKTVKLAKSRKH